MGGENARLMRMYVDEFFRESIKLGFEKNLNIYILAPHLDGIDGRLNSFYLFQAELTG